MVFGAFVVALNVEIDGATAFSSVTVALTPWIHDPVPLSAPVTEAVALFVIVPGEVAAAAPVTVSAPLFVSVPVTARFDAPTVSDPVLLTTRVPPLATVSPATETAVVTVTVWPVRIVTVSTGPGVPPRLVVQSPVPVELNAAASTRERPPRSTRRLSATTAANRSVHRLARGEMGGTGHLRDRLPTCSVDNLSEYSFNHHIRCGRSDYPGWPVGQLRKRKGQQHTSRVPEAARWSRTWDSGPSHRAG